LQDSEFYRITVICHYIGVLLIKSTWEESMASANKLSLSAKIFIAMIAGAIVGLILNYAGNPAWSDRQPCVV
jgi:hypothetical protein